MVTNLELAVADTTVLLTLTGALPFEGPPPTDTLLALDASLVDLIDVLGAFHEGRCSDAFGDLAYIGPMVNRWLPANQLATAVTELLLAHPHEAATDLASLAAAHELGVPLLSTQSHLATLDPRAQVIVLPRRTA